MLIRGVFIGKKNDLLISILVLVFSISLSLPPMRVLIERSMVWQMLIQIPLLVLGGFFLAQYYKDNGIVTPKWRNILNSWNTYGLTGFFLAQSILIYWMIPLNIDRAILLYDVDVLKIFTLILSGILLQSSFRIAPFVIQIFFLGYFIAMLVWLGLYFLETSVRLCNVYSLDSQFNTGYGLLFLSGILLTDWCIKVYRRGKI